MNNIAYKNANVFNNYYQGNNNYSLLNNSSSAYVGNFSNSKIFYSYYNKYFINDNVYLTLSSYSASQGYTLLNRRSLSRSFNNPDYVQQISYSSFSAQISTTGVNGYQYIYDNSSNFLGWFFPYQKSVILNNNFISRHSITSSVSFKQTISYYMSQQSYYINIEDNESNFSYNCVTAVQHSSMTADQFIKGSPTYITSVGLYDDEMNCLAVAKLSKPIQKLQFIPMSFKVRFFN